MNKRFKFWGQKVTGQGHCRVKYAPKCIFSLVVVTCWESHNEVVIATQFGDVLARGVFF